ncbi:MAG: dTDP-4-dehydrorhamnose 3,5-epimerase family protein [Deltaproteobacteria bacterium]|nr:dTDP-4-dehydrorhamnose 3,5-epimerase family protein [Deltaproteobacteria bacterium]
MEFVSGAEARYTVQTYGGTLKIEGVEFIDLTRHSDDGGALTELARMVSGGIENLPGFRPAQINYSEMDPGVIKAFHLHPAQTDVWFAPPDSKLLLVLVDVRKESASSGIRMRVVMGDGRSRLVRIPPGVAHGVRNLSGGRGRIIYFVDHVFDTNPQTTQEGRLPWDFWGSEIWEVERK